MTITGEIWVTLDRQSRAKVKKEKLRPRPGRWLTPEEEARLLALSPRWVQELVLFALHTGMRQSEILNLQWPHVDLTRRTLMILVQKNGGQDTLPLNATAVEVLQARARVRSIRTAHVFFNTVGRRRDARNLLRAFYAARRKAGIEKVRFHDLRHTFASRLVQSGGRPLCGPTPGPVEVDQNGAALRAPLPGQSAGWCGGAGSPSGD